MTSTKELKLEELGKSVAESLSNCGIVILQNHGAVAPGETFKLAAQKTRVLEEFFMLFLLSKQFKRNIQSFLRFYHKSKYN